MDTTSIGNGRWLRSDAAASYLRMVAARCPAAVTSAGRTPEEQVRLYTSRYSQVNTGVDHSFWRGKDWWRKNGVVGYVAVPGTSTHETGLSLDLPVEYGNPRAWVRTHGEAYGWIKDTVNNEPWHMTYIPARDTHQEDDMALSDADKEAIREIVANGLNLLLAEAAAGTTQRGRHTKASLQSILPDKDGVVDIAAVATAVAPQLKITTIKKG